MLSSSLHSPPPSLPPPPLPPPLFRPHPCFEQSLGLLREGGSDPGQLLFLEVTITTSIVAKSITARVVPLSQLLDKIVNL